MNQMKHRTRCLTLAGVITLIAAPLHTANNDTLRGFEPASQADELKWEQQARAIPDAARVRAFIEKLSNQAHMAGTPQSKETAEYILAQLREYGLDAHIEQYEALLPQPRSRSLEMTAPSNFRAKLEEPAVAADKNSADPGMAPSYLAYSGDGDVSAPLVYANYGIPADYEVLKQQGIDVKGRKWRRSMALSAASSIRTRATTAIFRETFIQKEPFVRRTACSAAA
jgi:N-acetylated-alpha-linked acidic dipeptidase